LRTSPIEQVWFVEWIEETIAAEIQPPSGLELPQRSLRVASAAGTNAKFGWVEPMYLYTEELGVETDL